MHTKTYVSGGLSTFMSLDIFSCICHQCFWDMLDERYIGSLEPLVLHIKSNIPFEILSLSWFLNYRTSNIVYMLRIIVSSKVKNVFFWFNMGSAWQIINLHFVYIYPRNYFILHIYKISIIVKSTFCTDWEAYIFIFRG